MVQPRRQTKIFKPPGQMASDQKGQVVVEYVLLLVIGVTVALLITNLMVSRNPDSPGFLTNKWQKMIEAIGDDMADSTE